jgi:dsDNA-specific endonuclease/ATPase MutS2
MSQPHEEEEPVFEWPITDTLDLHTVPPRDVTAVVEAWLEEVWERGFTALRIIHGKGIGVQREAVRKVLGRTPYVASFGDAPMEAGGWGTTVVTLGNRHPNSPDPAKR